MTSDAESSSRTQTHTHNPDRHTTRTSTPVTSTNTRISTTAAPNTTTAAPISTIPPPPGCPDGTIPDLCEACASTDAVDTRYFDWIVYLSALNSAYVPPAYFPSMDAAATCSTSADAERLTRGISVVATARLADCFLHVPSADLFSGSTAGRGGTAMRADGPGWTYGANDTVLLPEEGHARQGYLFRVVAANATAAPFFSSEEPSLETTAESMWSLIGFSSRAPLWYPALTLLSPLLAEFFSTLVVAGYGPNVIEEVPVQTGAGDIVGIRGRGEWFTRSALLLGATVTAIDRDSCLYETTFHSSNNMAATLDRVRSALRDAACPFAAAASYFPLALGTTSTPSSALRNATAMDAPSPTVSDPSYDARTNIDAIGILAGSIASMGEGTLCGSRLPIALEDLLLAVATRVMNSSCVVSGEGRSWDTCGGIAGDPTRPGKVDPEHTTLFAMALERLATALGPRNVQYPIVNATVARMYRVAAGTTCGVLQDDALWSTGLGTDQSYGCRGVRGSTAATGILGCAARRRNWYNPPARFHCLRFLPTPTPAPGTGWPESTMPTSDRPLTGTTKPNTIRTDTPSKHVQQSSGKDDGNKLLLVAGAGGGGAVVLVGFVVGMMVLRHRRKVAREHAEAALLPSPSRNVGFY